MASGEETNHSQSLTIHHGQVSKVSANLPPVSSKDRLVQKCTEKGRQKYLYITNIFVPER